MSRKKEINIKKQKDTTMAHMASIETSLDQDYSNMIHHFKNNLKKFKKVNNLSNATLAEKLGCTIKTIDSYIAEDCNKIATPRVLGKLKTVYDISLDDFLFYEMSADELRREEVNFPFQLFYKGLYMIYYLSTSEFKGSDTKDATEALRYGILYVYDFQNKPTTSADGTSQVKEDVQHPKFQKPTTLLNCIAGLAIEGRQRADDLYSQCKRLINQEDCETKLKALLEDTSFVRTYYGKMSIGQNHYYLSLSHLSEIVLMIGYTINDTESPNYIGGLVTVNSVSRGREAAPVLQLAGLSRNQLNCSDEELEAALHMDFKIKTEHEADRILNFVKNPPGSTIISEEHRLNEEQLKAILTAEIEYELRKIVEKRVYRLYKMIPSEDSLFYHYLITQYKGTTGADYGQGKY